MTKLHIQGLTVACILAVVGGAVLIVAVEIWVYG